VIDRDPVTQRRSRSGIGAARPPLPQGAVGEGPEAVAERCGLLNAGDDHSSAEGVAAGITQLCQPTPVSRREGRGRLDLDADDVPGAVFEDEIDF
jgi:hypothetical protein